VAWTVCNWFFPFSARPSLVWPIGWLVDVRLLTERNYRRG
jgi:hypothetical protein